MIMSTQSPPLPRVPTLHTAATGAGEPGKAPSLGRQHPPQPPSVTHPAPYLRWGARANCRTPGISPSTWHGALCPAWGCRREGPDVCVAGVEREKDEKELGCGALLHSFTWADVQGDLLPYVRALVCVTDHELRGPIFLPAAQLRFPHFATNGTRRHVEKRSYLPGGELG